MVRVIILSLFLFFINSAQSNAIFLEKTNSFPDIPDMNQFVNDYHGVLSITQKIELNKELELLRNESGIEFLILIVSSTSGEKIRHYTIRAMDAWDHDYKDRSIDMLMVIDAEDASFFIGTRPAIQKYLPDELVQFICDEKIIPYWKSEEWFEGIKAGVTELINVLKYENIERVVFESKVLLTWRNWLVFSLLIAGFVYTFIYFIWMKSENDEI